MDFAADLTQATFAAMDALRDGRDPQEAIQNYLRPQGLTWGDREIASRALASARRDFAAIAAVWYAPTSPLTDAVNAELAEAAQ